MEAVNESAHADTNDRANTPKIILVIDDTPTNLDIVTTYLQGQGYETLVARDGVKGFQRAQDVKPDLILLDVTMPGIDGFETCRRLKNDAGTQNIPVIFLTGMSGLTDKVKGFELGAVDYITKPFQQGEMLARVKNHLALQELTQRLQTRTAELHQANAALSKRAMQLELSSQVSQQLTSILDLDELLTTIVESIQTKFGYYFVGIFLPDKLKAALILHASSSKASLTETLTIPLNHARSITTWVYNAGQAYQADEVESDDKYLALEALPDTRSELALPLRFGDELMGVLNIQSDTAGAFDREDQAALQSLANQIAVAMRNARLYQLEKKINEDKDKFITIFSHDLKGPFTNLLGNTEYILWRLGQMDEAELRDIIQTLHDGVKRAHHLLENLLTWSRMQRHGGLTCQPEAIELRLLAQKSVDLLTPLAAQKNITLRNHLPAGLMAYADPFMIATVLRNLTSNALKFTMAGGEVSLTAQPTPAADGYLIIGVTDTGVGLSETQQADLFRVGHNYSMPGTNDERGSGLGLMICKEMIEQHSGRLWLESEIGRGTTVKFTLPAMKP